jgi:hypothetical protein
LAAAIAASNGVLPPVGGMALSVTLLRVEASLKKTRLALEGCTLVSSDGDSVSIFGGVHNLDFRDGCNNQIDDLKVGFIQLKGS